MLTIRRRAMLAQATAAVLPLGPAYAVATMAPNVTLPESVVSGILDAGGWTPMADDDGHDERLPQSFLAAMAKWHSQQPNDPAALASLGVLVLTLSVAEWGVAWDTTAPGDPANSAWRGPPSIRFGKHLMSYTLGGIGLPHLDDGSAAAFFTTLANRVPEAADDLQKLGATSPAFRYDDIRARGGVCDPNLRATAPMKDLDGEPFPNAAASIGGVTYCRMHAEGHATDVEAWRRLQHWSRVALRRRDMQVWIITHWLNGYWVPAYNAVMRNPAGTLGEALVVARMWNSSPTKAHSALDSAAGLSVPSQRIDRELATYAAISNTDSGRIGLMRRPAVAYAAVAGVQV